MLKKAYIPQTIDVCQCLDCGAVFDGKQYKVCPRCQGVNYTAGLNIEATFYAAPPADEEEQEKRETEIRFYADSLADGKAFEADL